MLQLAVVICVVLWTGPAEAIKWDFDDGTTQGWTTKEALTWGGTREFHQFPGMVEDGVWRIEVDPSITNSLGVEAFEIDWIELTGVEEMMEGKLPPPPVEYYFGFEGAGLFAPPVFYPIAPGIGEIGGSGGGYLGEVGGNVLTDLDGDGDLDLFGLWETQTEIPQGREEKNGWLMAVNDGRGALERGPVIEEVAAKGGVVLEATGGDLTGDGKDEIAISRSNREPSTEVWSIGPDLQVEVLAQIDESPHSVADWDGDGRDELFVGGLILKAL